MEGGRFTSRSQMVESERLSEKKESSEDEVIVESVGDLRADIDWYLLPEGKYSHRYTIKMASGIIQIKLLDECPAVKRLCHLILERENMLDGALSMVIRRGRDPLMALDRWHDDGEVVYVYSNQEPTEILRDPLGKYAEACKSGTLVGIDPDPEDIGQPPDESLVRLSPTTVHKRPVFAAMNSDRYSLRITLQPSS